MSDTDGGLRTLFRDNLRRGFHWQSIETGVMGPGTPDTNFGAAGVERWIEFKQTDGWACTLRVEQIGWHVKRHLAGGVTFIATRRWKRSDAGVDELWLHHGRWARELKTAGLPAIDPLGVWTGGPGGWDWEEIAAHLTRRD